MASQTQHVKALFGPRAFVRRSPKAPVAAERAELSAWLKKYRAEFGSRLTPQAKEVRDRVLSYRYRILIEQGWCNSQIGYGDTFEEAVERAKRSDVALLAR